MPRVNAVTRRDLITLALILFVAAIVRLGDPGIVEFKLDEAALALKAQDMVRDAGVPLVGIPSSVGVPNSPMSVYFLAIPYLFGNDPILATMFIAAFNVLGVGLLWLIAHRTLDKTVALAAALAYALNPWAVLFSRKIWEQNMHTPILLAALLLGLSGFYEGRKWAQVLCAPLLLLAVQFHPATWALLPLFLVLLWMGRRLISWPAVAASLVLAALVMLPYALGIGQAFADNPGLLSSFASHSTSRGLGLSSDALRWMADLTTGLGIETQVAPHTMNDLLLRVPPQPQLWALLGALTPAGLGFVWVKRYRPLGALIVAWALLPLIVFTPTWTDVFPHYFIASIPAFCLLAGISVGWLARNLPGRPMSRVVILTAFVAILLTQGLWWRGLMRYVDSVPTPDGFGTPLHRLTAIRDSVAQAQDVIAVVPGAVLGLHREPTVWTSLLMRPGRCVRAVDSRDLIVLPSGPFAALVAPGLPESAAKTLYTQGHEVGSFDVVENARRYTVYRFDAAPSDAVSPLTSMTPVPFANGVSLSGYAIAPNRVMLSWTLPGPSAVDTHLFVHLLDANGDKVAQQDQPFFAGRFWCDGDRVMIGSALDVPASATTLRAGLYVLDGKDVRNVDVVGADGQPVGSWVDVKIP